LALEIRGLRKTYRSAGRDIAAVDGLDLEVPAGGVFGFLGPNGSGKTTTIRAIVGLLAPSAGTINVLGVACPAGLNDVIDRVGALVEAPSFFPSFSGYRNLSLLAESRGFPRARVHEALATVGLTDRAGSRVSTYSLGMRQRLGVAAVLLKDPDLLILDEPANGLDPEGIAEMRALLRHLGDQGRTVFVSSHILAEIEHTCDRVAVLARGRCVTSGTVADLVRTDNPRCRVNVADAERDLARARATLQSAGFVTMTGSPNGLIVEVEPSRTHLVTQALAAQQIWVSELTPIERSLEEAFLQLVADADTDADTDADPRPT
jgi:ABC-2 type transport system ATP-binding protein